MVAKNEENRLPYCSALSEQSDRVKFDDDVKEAFRNEKEKKKSREPVNFVLHSLLRKMLRRFSLPNSNLKLKGQRYQNK